MKTIHFKCTLLPDLIITANAATEGNQQTNDFIPGNTFLGLAAGKLYKHMDADDAMILFHSGKVRFSDAHPLINDTVALRVPASWYVKKGDELSKGLYIHHHIPENGIKDKDGNPIQIKQQRQGFFYYNGGYITYKPQTNFAIKSAYDIKTRRSKDAQMYGYESLEAGSVWHFEISFDDEASHLENQIRENICGETSIGRSSSAQYGLVEIEEIKTSGFNGVAQSNFNDGENLIIYAVSRLIFLDDFGQPTFTPEPSHFGLSKGQIDWNKSQIRTFQYAPYNGKRRTREADRCGIEKGSVIYIEGASSDDLDIVKANRGFGRYLNEGFGKILINPLFLYTDKPDGRAGFEISQTEINPPVEHVGSEISNPENKVDHAVLSYLIMEKNKKEKQLEIYNSVNQYVKDNAPFFRGGKFASQWGAIRKLAMKASTKEKLTTELFEDNKGYLVHGVAKEKWEGKKTQRLQAFLGNLDDEIAIKTIVNLAAEMAKKCKED